MNPAQGPEGAFALCFLARGTLCEVWEEPAVAGSVYRTKEQNPEMRFSPPGLLEMRISVSREQLGLHAGREPLSTTEPIDVRTHASRTSVRGEGGFMSDFTIQQPIGRSVGPWRGGKTAAGQVIQLAPVAGWVLRTALG